MGLFNITPRMTRRNDNEVLSILSGRKVLVPVLQEKSQDILAATVKKIQCDSLGSSARSAMRDVVNFPAFQSDTRPNDGTGYSYGMTDDVSTKIRTFVITFGKKQSVKFILKPTFNKDKEIVGWSGSLAATSELSGAINAAYKLALTEEKNGARRQNGQGALENVALGFRNMYKAVLPDELYAVDENGITSEVHSGTNMVHDRKGEENSL